MWSPGAVFAARKLTVILWHILTNGEPSRYVPERTTREKIARMHYQATGVRHTSGPPKGASRSPFYGTGQRGRAVRARADHLRLQQAQQDYERLANERIQNATRRETS